MLEWLRYIFFFVFAVFDVSPVIAETAVSTRPVVICFFFGQSGTPVFGARFRIRPTEARGSRLFRMERKKRKTNETRRNHKMYRVLPSFTEFYRVLPSFTEFERGLGPSGWPFPAVSFFDFSCPFIFYFCYREEKNALKKIEKRQPTLSPGRPPQWPPKDSFFLLAKIEKKMRR